MFRQQDEASYFGICSPMTHDFKKNSVCDRSYSTKTCQIVVPQCSFIASQIWASTQSKIRRRTSDTALWCDDYFNDFLVIVDYRISNLKFHSRNDFQCWRSSLWSFLLDFYTAYEYKYWYIYVFLHNDF